MISSLVSVIRCAHRAVVRQLARIANVSLVVGALTSLSVGSSQRRTYSLTFLYYFRPIPLGTNRFECRRGRLWQARVPRSRVRQHSPHFCTVRCGCRLRAHPCRTAECALRLQCMERAIHMSPWYRQTRRRKRGRQEPRELQTLACSPELDEKRRHRNLLLCLQHLRGTNP
jgi:hypothetical protein